MKIKATFQIEGKSDVEKVLEGEDNREIWNLLVSEVSKFFPDHDENKIALEKKMPDPVFMAKNEKGEVLCHVLCEQI